uniref:Uncharacterized protein n=1 Tax=viral metagenome TaxID=1070528 RepID=A0A6C0C1D8_9ZZZZ
MSCFTFVLVVACLCVLALTFQTRRCATLVHTPIRHSVMFCTVSSLDSGVPTQPTSFSAHFYNTKFVLAVSPHNPEDFDVPGPEMGTFTYSEEKESKFGTLTMEQLHKSAKSVLTLNFTHSAGGILSGIIYERGAIIAKQCGVFHICPDTVS